MLARKPTVAATVLNSAAPCTVSVQPGDACHNVFTKKDDEMEDEAPHNNYDHEHDNDSDAQDEDEDDQLAD